MQRFFIDTNIFLRVLIKEEEKTFNDCLGFLKKIKTNKIQAVTSSIVLAEIVWTLISFYSFSRKQTSQAVLSILNLRGLQIIDSYDHQKALSIFTQKKVKYIDALISSIKEIDEKEWIIVSYDKDFDKLDVARKEPGEIESPKFPGTKQ